MGSPIEHGCSPKKMKARTQKLEEEGEINEATRKMVELNADSSRFFAAAVVTFHEWVHNHRTNPDLGTLRDAWDEMEPFFAGLSPCVATGS